MRKERGPTFSRAELARENAYRTQAAELEARLARDEIVFLRERVAQLERREEMWKRLLKETVAKLPW